MEFISLLCYWVDFGLMLYEYQYCSLFKAMGVLRPLKLLSILPGTAVILKSLETGWDLLLDVSGFLFFFMFLFALVGLVTFHGVFSRQCYFFPDGPDGVLVEPPMYCSGYYNGSTIVGPFDIATQSNDFPGYQGYICNDGQRCMATPSNNPSYGFMNFDMIFSAFLNVYTFVSMELWTDMMYITQDADSRLAALYYCIGVYLIGFILIYLLFAVITSAFARVRAANQKLLHLHHGSHYQQSRQSIDSEGDEGSQFVNNAGNTSINNGNTTYSQFSRWRSWMIKWVQSRTFFYIGSVLVLIDTLFMCLRSVYASESMLEFLDNVETGFTFIFAIEIVIRIVGTQHWLQFWNSNRNKLDLIIVITTCVIQLPMIQDDPVYMYLTIFQVLRTYRLFSLVPRVEKLLNAALGTGESFINVVIFLLLSTALFSTVFMQLFGGDFVDFMEPNDEKLRFDTFWQSYVSLIMLYTSETWTDTLYDAMQSQQYNGGAVYAGIATCLYFAYARYIVAGLYIAVILENFELDDEYIRHYQIKHFIREKMATKQHTNNTYIHNLLRFIYKKDNQKDLIQVKGLPANLTTKFSEDAIRILSYDDNANNMPLTEKNKNPASIEFNSFGSNSTFFNKPQHLTDTDNRSNSTASKKKIAFIPNKIAKFFEDDYDTIVAEENEQAILEKRRLAGIEDVRSLFIFSEKNILRRGCKRLVGSCKDGKSERKNIFNWFIMGCVLVSILVVILDEPSTRKLRATNHDVSLIAFNDDSIIDGWTTYDLIDMVLGCIFVFEMILRIIADGFILPHHSYLRYPWNRLDFVVTMLNFGTLFSGDQDLPRALGTVRSMRILRLIRYFSGVRDVFIDLFHAFPLMLDAMLLTFLVMIPFSVYGVNIFGGRFWSCNDDSVGGKLECINEFVLDIGSEDGYSLPLLVPRSWSNPYRNLYSYDDFPIALRHLFSLTSTEGWVNSMFHAMSTPMENDIQPKFDWNSPTVYHSIYYVIFMIISHGTVQLFVGVIIEKFKQRSGITTLTFAQRQYVDLQRQLAGLKPTMKVFRPTTPIRCWCYDLVANRYSLFNRVLIGIVILNMYCLIFAAFRLGEGIDALQTLYHTIAMATPSIIRVSAVFMLVMCLFAMIFMEFFGLTKYGEHGTDNSNFRTYGNALLLLVRMTTGEGWNEVMMDYTFAYPNCVESSDYLNNDCGSANWAYFLFNFFYITCTHIFLNLFTAVILSNFEYAYETRSRFTLITKNDLRWFKQAWSEVDPQATGYIKKEDVAKLFQHLTGRFKINIYDKQYSLKNLCRLSRQQTSTLKDYSDLQYNLKLVNQCLSTMDTSEVGKRRKQYNLLYMEIVDAETSKGISFSDVLHIMSLRFVDIETALTLHPMLERLEKLDQFNKAYANEKACGVLLTVIQRKRYLRQLWQKRDEEAQIMSLNNDYQLSPRYGSGIRNHSTGKIYKTKYSICIYKYIVLYSKSTSMHTHVFSSYYYG
ncbi:Ion transport protein-domain-containing protein [Cunninghamella echinulata]|nr:Ion transport protein-domain-containing protein [Cunninghamella echinulata]